MRGGLWGGLEWERRACDDRAEPPPAGPRAPAFIAGLDLGQAADFSALVVVERRQEPDPSPERAGKFVNHYDVRHLHRWPLKTPYPEIVADVKGLFAAGPLAKGTLVIDQTGVGRAVVDMFRAAKIDGTMRPFTITSGGAITGSTVAKKHLVAAVQAPLSSGRLRFAAALELTPVLVEELMNFRAKVTADRNETFESWRERDHDDLVLALALALHVAGIPPVSVSWV